MIGPSNPVISIGPILAVPGMRELLSEAAAPVVAVSPFVAGKVIKGPTDKFMRAIGQQPSAAGVVKAYEGLLDGVIVDAADPIRLLPASAPPSSTRLMDGAEGRLRVAEETLDFCRSLLGDGT